MTYEHLPDEWKVEELRVDLMTRLPGAVLVPEGPQRLAPGNTRGYPFTMSCTLDGVPEDIARLPAPHLGRIRFVDRLRGLHPRRISGQTSGLRRVTEP